MIGLAEVEIMPETTDKTVSKGFNDPDILQKALRTRRLNRGVPASEPEGLQEQEEPAEIDEPGPDKAEPERRRGRPKGARNSRDTKSLQNIETMLLAVHAMAAMYVGIPELKLDKDDAKTLAEALANVGQYHHVKLDGRTGAYLGLLFAVGKVYGPMGIMAYNKLRNSNNANKAP